MKIIYSTLFEREYKKLPPEIKDSAEKRETLFRKDPFDSRLHTHKLKGKLSKFWAFSIDYSNRILFEFIDDDTVYFHSVGDHSIYD